MKKILIAVVIIILAGTGIYFFNKKETTPKPVYKETCAETDKLSEYIETTGQVEPLNRVEILPPSGGRIEKIMTEEGREATNGEVLALMSSQDRVAILDAARAMGDKELSYWQDTYKPIKIIAPLSGRIILRNIVEGQTVSAGTVLFAMSDKLIVTASVDESDIGKVKTGQKAFINLDAYPDSNVTGRVFQILDEGKNTNNVIIYKVKISLDKVPSFFKSQMTANIKIETAKDKEALVVPSNAVKYSKEGKTYIITGFDKKGEPIQTPVETGSETRGKIEIQKGLNEGDKIYMEEKAYKVQKVSQDGSSPFMPKRPTGNAGKAMRKAR